MKLNTLTRIKAIGLVWIYYLSLLFIIAILLIILTAWAIPMVLFKRAYVKWMNIFSGLLTLNKSHGRQ